MNPGLLREPLSLHRQGTARDALGQPLPGWTLVPGTESFRGRRMKPKSVILQENVIADRERERQRAIFRLRSQPFLTFYQPGDRLQEPQARLMPATSWEIEGWAEVEGTQGHYIDVSVIRIT